MNKKILITIAFLLVGCSQQDLTYQYLMQHPVELERAAIRCQTSDATACDVVQHAAEDFSALINQRAKDPQLFGERILQAQEALEKLTVTDPAYHEQDAKVRVLLAVVAATSAE